MRHEQWTDYQRPRAGWPFVFCMMLFSVRCSELLAFERVSWPFDAKRREGFRGLAFAVDTSRMMFIILLTQSPSKLAIGDPTVEECFATLHRAIGALLASCESRS